MLVTTDTLLTRARAISDMADNFVSRAVWLLWLNQANLQLSLFIARAGYMHRPVVLPLTATGASTYAVPECMAIVGVHEKRSGGGYRRIEPNQAVEGLYPDSASVGFPQRWHADTADDGSIALSFYPNPGSGDYVVTYLATPTPLVWLGDALLEEPVPTVSATVNYPMGWEEWLVLEMARHATIKEEGDTRAIEKLKQDIEQHIGDSIHDRALNDAPVVRNTDSTSPYTLSLVYGPRGAWRFF